MKKIIVVSIVFAGFVSIAQAQSNVAVYGVVDLGLAKTTGQSVVVRENHASRLGFRGTEDLGNGYSAVFMLETEILADTGAYKGALFDRQAYVGLKGSFGTVYFGRTKDIIDGAIGRVEPFGADGVIGKVNEPMMRGGVGASRVANAITYNSPDASGFGVSLQAVLSEVRGMDSGSSLLLTYSKGGATAHLGYQRPVQTLPGVSPTLFSAGAAYKFGALRLSAGYSKGDTDVPLNGTYKSVLFGAVYALGAGDFKAVAGRQHRTTSQFTGTESVRETGVGYDYHLSKRTDLYAYAGHEKVKSVTSYQAGLSHKF